MGEDAFALMLFRYSILYSPCALSVAVVSNVGVVGGMKSSRKADGKAEKKDARDDAAADAPRGYPQRHQTLMLKIARFGRFLRRSTSAAICQVVDGGG